MRIVLVPANAPQTCVYCRDSLGPGSLDACKKCGTRYHAECAALAGSCALIGCDGTFETARAGGASDARVALVVLPGGAPGKEQLEAVARVLRATEWDARQRLGSAVPFVLGYFTRNALAHATTDLEAAGVSAFAIDAAALAAGERFVVRSVDLAGDRALTVRDEAGTERLLPLGEPNLIVVARYATEAVERHDTPAANADERPGRTDSFFPRRKKQTRATTFARVIHLYRDASPYVFDESVIDDFRFLGERMSASSTQNFQMLLSLLAEGARHVDRSLEKAGSAHMRHLPEASYRGSRRSNRAWVDATSLLVFHAHAPGEATDPKAAQGS